jgi:hypothetical protein
LPLVFIPHWNNQEGGEELDTSRCFMGQQRFARLMEMLPAGLTVLGIDEKTALIMDLERGTCRVAGLGGVTLIHTGHAHAELEPEADLAGTGLPELAEIRDDHVHVYHTGQTFPLSECCPLNPPEPGMGVPEPVWQEAFRRRQALQISRSAGPSARQAPPEVLALVEARQAARQSKDWSAADEIRQQIAALGWQVKDTPDGPSVEAG